MWHEQEAKRVLNKYLESFERLMMFADLAVKGCNNRFNRKAANHYRQVAIKSKTLGVVFHDRHKLILDCPRKFSI